MEISNKTLAMLFLVAIVISVGGTIFNLQRIRGVSEIQGGFPQQTGFATANDTGIVQLNISQVTEIILDVATVDFGSGYVANSSICNLTTVNPSDSTSMGCSGFYNNTIPSPLHLRNIGNQNVTVDLRIDTNITNWFNCGGGACAETDAAIAINVSNNQSGSCNGLNASFNNWGVFGEQPGVIARENLLRYPTFNETRICGTTPTSNGLYFLAGNNTITINVAVWMYQNSSSNLPGAKNINFTFIGTSA